MREVDRLKYAYARGGKHLTRLEAFRYAYRGKRTLDDLAAEKLAARIEADENVRKVIARFGGDPVDAYQEIWVLGPSVLREILANPMARDADKISALQLAGKATGHLDERVDLNVTHTIPYLRLVSLPGELPLDGTITDKALPALLEGSVDGSAKNGLGGKVLAEGRKDGEAAKRTKLAATQASTDFAAAEPAAPCGPPATKPPTTA